MDGGNAPPVGMGVDEGEHFLHNRDTSVATLPGPFAFGSERQGSTLASRLSDTQNCEGPHAPRSFSRANRHNLLIVRTGDHRAFSDTVHQDPPAAGRRCTRSIISRCRSSAQACRASIARCFWSATAGRRSVAIFPPCASTALRPFGRPRCRGVTSVHPAAGVFPFQFSRFNATGASKLSATVSE